MKMGWTVVIQECAFSMAIQQCQAVLMGTLTPHTQTLHAAAGVPAGLGPRDLWVCRCGEKRDLQVQKKRAFERKITGLENELWE